MANTSNKRSEILVFCNTKQAQNELKKWQGQLKAAKAEMQQLAAAGKTSSQRYLELDRDVKNLSKSISVNKSHMDRVNNVLNNLSKSSLRQCRMAVRDLKREMDKMSETDPNLKKTRDNLRRIEEQMRKLKGETERANGGMGALWEKMKNVGGYVAITMALNRVKSLVMEVINLNLKFSDQMANIRKVSGLAYSDITRLTNNLAKIDTRTSIEELNNIAYAGAKLGIAKWGTEALEGFVTAANKVNVALKEDMGEEALTALSKMTEVMGLIPKMGVEKSMLATGSAIFQLGATSTANASNIVEFSKRLMGMAQTAGITMDQLLALGSASDSMGLMPEVSATAFNRFISSLQSKHNLIEKDLGISPGTINDLYSAGRAIDAIVLIFEKMKQKGNMNALNGIFKDLGSEGARLTNVMVTMSRRVDMLKEHLYTSQEAFEEGSAVTNEYNIQQETAAALMERAANTWEKTFVNSRGVDAVKEVAQAWYDLSVSLTSSSGYMGMAKFALMGIYESAKLLISALPVLINFLLFRGAATAILAVRGAIVGVATAIRAASAAQVVFNSLGKANVWAVIATAVVSVVTAVYSFVSAMDEVEEKQRTVNGYLVEANREFERESRALQNFVRVANDVNLSQKERQKTIAKFNQEYRPYLSRLGLEVKNATDLKNAYSKVNDELRKKMYYQMRDRAYNEILGPENDAQSKALLDYGDIVNNRMPEFKAFTTSWLLEQVDRGRPTKSVFMDLMRGRYGKENVFWDEKSQSIWAKGSFGNGSNMRNLLGSDNEESKLFWSINEAIRSARAYRDKKKNIDSAFNPIIGDYVPWMDEPVGTLENEAPDKQAALEAKRQEQERRRALREDLKQQQDEARAVMDNIKNFYQRQITQVLKTANEQGWDEKLLQSATDAVLARQNLALSQARKGIAGISSSWEDFKLSMRDDMIEVADEVGYNESKQLLDLILSNNLKALHDKINGIEKDLGLPTNAATDAIWKNASLNEKANETATQRRLRERQRRLLEDNFTARVDNQYLDSMTQLGFFDVSDAQSQILFDAARGPEQAAAAEVLMSKRKAEIEELFRAVRENIVEISQIGDVTGEGGRNSLMAILFGEGWQSADSSLRLLLDSSGDDLQQFYGELLKYSDDYTAALKQAHDRQKKLLDFQWGRTPQYIDNQRRQSALAMASSGVGQHNASPAYDSSALPYRDAYGTHDFISSMGADPEVEAYRLKMEAAADYYEFLKAHKADADSLRTAEQGILSSEMEYVKAVAAQMKERLNDVYELAAPVEAFGTSMGEAFGTMVTDADEGRKAVKAAIADMIKGFMKQTVAMTQEYIKRRIMQKANDRLTSLAIVSSTRKEVALEKSKQSEIIDVQSAGGEVKEALNAEVAGKIQSATAEIGQQTVALHKEQTQQEVSTEAGKTQANVGMGIASGAAKIIGSLGWWGIPLIAVITALLNGLLSFAMSRVSSLFGGGDSATASAPAKLVSGMLTYDSGNVQAFRGVMDGRSYPVVGNDGRVYAARDGGELSTGLVRDPITTLVNGQPALVAERGPEMVIGRETTAAMMMARPDILAEIVKFDRARSGRTYRAYDGGNVGDFVLPAPQNSMSAEDIAELRSTIATLSSVLANIQQRGIRATINNLGRGGVAEAAKMGADFMRKNSGDRLWQK